MNKERKAFQFKQFSLNDKACAMKLSTDAVILGAWAKFSTAGSILDIGTGSGILALIAAQRNLAEITAIDIDEDSINQAKENFFHSKWENRIQAKHISLQDFFKETTGKFDYIICNPPYFVDSMKSPSNKTNLAKHTITLNYEVLFTISKQIMNNKSFLGIIIPEHTKKHVLETASLEGFHLSRILNIIPKPQKACNRVCMEFSFEKVDIEHTSLVIRNDLNAYTEEYKRLTKDFYTIF